jgi:hypothetical protein
MPCAYASYDGYGENYKKLLPLLDRDGLLANAARLGAVIEGESARISCLGREYIITRTGVEAADGLPSDENLRGVLIYYAISQGAGKETGEFALLNRLSGMHDGQTTLAKDMMTSTLLREFKEPERFDAAVTRLGGERLPQESGGRHVWQLRVLPPIVMRFVFYEADEEFPAEFQIMFDTVATRYLEFECLAFLTGSVVKELVETSL